MRALHLCAGAGGSVIAGRLLGFESVGCVEIDDYCCEVLKRHGERIVGRDLTRFTATHLRGHVDIVIGGTPCQDLSVAGLRAGLEGERSGLWLDFLRIVKECRAPLCWWENVGGALSSNDGRDFGVIMHSLASAGYDAEWVVNEALEVGAPHHRERVWVLAHARCAVDERRGITGDIRGAADAVEGDGAQRERGRNAAGDGGEVVAGTNRRDGGADHECPTGSEAPGGTMLGNAAGSGRGAPHPSGESGLPGQTGFGTMADAARQRSRQGWSESDKQRRTITHDDGPANHAANTGRERLQKWRSEWRRAYGPAASPYARLAESGLGGSADGMAAQLHFPAARGLQVAGRRTDGPSPQHQWEPPRTIAPLEPVAARLAGRIPRLKALGNGWVPAQAVAAFLEMTEDL